MKCIDFLLSNQFSKDIIMVDTKVILNKNLYSI